MKRNILKAFVSAAGVAVIMLIVGCEEQQQQQPSTKMAKVVAAENIQLKKDLQQRDSEIEGLKEQHSNELKEQQELIAKCQDEERYLQEQLAGRFEGQMKEMFDTLVEEAGKLQKENEQLKAQIEVLKADLEKLKAQGGLEAEPNEPAAELL
jgi:DNA anti-recombination protein RmuC